MVDDSGEVLGRVPAVELVTVGQRKGLGDLHIPAPTGTSAATAAGSALSSDERRYVLDVDVAGPTVTVGPLSGLLVSEIEVRNPAWVDGAPDFRRAAGRPDERARPAGAGDLVCGRERMEWCASPRPCGGLPRDRAWSCTAAMPSSAGAWPGPDAGAR